MSNRISTWARASVAIIVLLAGLVMPVISGAHALGMSYIWLQVNEDGMQGRIEIISDDLSAATGFELAEDKVLTEAQRLSVGNYLSEHFSVGSDGVDYQLRLDSIEVMPIEKVADYIVILYSLDAPLPVPDQIDISYSAVMHAVSEHRGGFHLENNYKTGVIGNHKQVAVIFAPGRESTSINLLGDNWFQQLLSFVHEGVIHIWIGYDHVLFLISLLLTAVLVRQGNVWVPADTLRTSIWNVVGVVTIFTVAHSITLALALKGWIVLPSRFVESVIALSILVVAIDNFTSILGKAKWTTVFVFGLFHGLGFAAVMEELALDFTSKVIALVGFNVGVELGQLAIVLVVFPVIFALRKGNYINLVLRPVSALVGLMALWWFITRAFNLESGWTSF